MSRSRFIVLLIAAFLAITGALYLSAQRNLPPDTRGTRGAKLLPALADELNTVSEVTVRKGAPTPKVTIHKKGDAWSIAERGDYPADVSKLRRLLLALSEAKIIEEKTSNPASYAVIGVEDPAKAGATGAQIDLTAAGSKLGVIIGRPAGEGNFVRRAAESKSYTIEPSISVDTEPRQWIDSRLIDIATDKIDKIDVKPASGPAYSIHRLKDAPADAGFALDEVPRGRTAADGRSIAPSPAALSGLGVEDVAPAASVDFTNAATATLTLSDGNVITIAGAPSGDKHWIRIATAKDEALNAKASGRVFDIAGYRYDGLFRPLEQLLVPKETPPAKATAGASKPSGPIGTAKQGHPAPSSSPLP